MTYLFACEQVTNLFVFYIMLPIELSIWPTLQGFVPNPHGLRSKSSQDQNSPDWKSSHE